MQLSTHFLFTAILATCNLMHTSAESETPQHSRRGPARTNRRNKTVTTSTEMNQSNDEDFMTSLSSMVLGDAAVELSALMSSESAGSQHHHHQMLQQHSAAAALHNDDRLVCAGNRAAARREQQEIKQQRPEEQQQKRQERRRKMTAAKRH